MKVTLRTTIAATLSTITVVIPSTFAADAKPQIARHQGNEATDSADALSLGFTVATAANAKALETPLIAVGQTLEAQYAAQLKALRADIEKVLPKIDEQQLAAIQKARDAKKKSEAEANAAQQSVGKIQTAKALVDHARGIIGQNGVITIPAVAHSKPSGQFAALKSFPSGMQLHCTGGFKSEYTVEVPRAGKYVLTARVVTVQEGQEFQIAENDAKSAVRIAVPYTIGKWQQTTPVELALVGGKNVLHFTLVDGSRGVSIKEFTLTLTK